MSKLREISVLVIIFAVVSAVALLIFNSCAMTPEKETGSIVLRVNEHSDYSIKSIVPDLDMNVHQYVVSISGTNTYDFTLIKPNSTYAISRMPLGSYNINISGENSALFEIGYGSDSFVIEAGTTTQVEVTIVPLSGEGTLTLDISWTPEEIVGIPSVQSSLAPVDTMIPVDISSAYTLTASSTNYSDTMMNGWKVLTYLLKDDGESVYGFAEAVRIVKNELSEGIVALTQDDITGAVGNLDLIIFEDMQNPIDVSLTGVMETLSEMSTMSVTANVTEAVDFYWYLSGVPAGTNSNTIVLDGAVLGQGNYRLDCIVKATNRLSSEGASFSVVEDSIVTFPCSGLQHAVEMALTKAPDEPIYLSEVQAITQLGANGLDVTDLTGLEYFINMTVLTMSNNYIVDLSPIAELTQLVDLQANVNDIVSTLPLSLLVNLVKLELLSNPLSNLDGIAIACDGGLTGCAIQLPSSMSGDPNVDYIISCGNTITFI